MRSSGLGVPENSLELIVHGRGTEVQSFWVCPDRGGEPRSSGLGVTASGLGPAVSRWGARERGLEVGVRSGGTEVEWFGSKRERLGSDLGG
jgi:hypothetical protein